MSLPRTQAFATFAEAADSEPVLLVRILLPGGTRHYASRGGVYGHLQGDVRRQPTASTAKGEGVTVLTWDHTIQAGPDLALFVGLTLDDPTMIPDEVTFHSLPLTFVGNMEGDGFSSVSVWRLVNPPVGTHPVNAVFPFATYPVGGAVSFEWVDQRTPVSGGGGAKGTGTSASRTTPTTPGGFALCVIGIDNDHASTWADQDEDTRNWKDATSQITGGSTCQGAAGASTVVGASWTGSDPWVIYSLCVNRAEFYSQTHEELPSSGFDLSMGIDRYGQVQQSSGSLLLSNLPDASGARLSDSFATEIWDNASIQIDQTFIGLDMADVLPVFRGILRLPEDAFDDTSVRLEITDDGQPTPPEITPLRQNRIQRLLGQPITLAEFPRADPKILGRIKPIGYGFTWRTPLLPVDAGAEGQLTSYLDPDDILRLTNREDWERFPESGRIQIGSEQIDYGYKWESYYNLRLDGLTRAVNGTIEEIHPPGTDVWEVRATYRYLVWGHRGDVFDIYIDGARVDPILGSWTQEVDANGNHIVIFSVKPNKALTIQVTQQPESLAVTIAEQGAQTDPGSHDHTATVSDFQLGGGSYPRVVQADTNFDFVDPSDFSVISAIWKVVLDSSVMGSPNGIVRYAIGQNVFQWKYPNAPPRTWQFSGAGNENTLRISFTGAASSVTVLEVSRIVKYIKDTSADPASGVAANLTGATATDVFLTQPVMVGGAIEIARALTADANGTLDDEFGTLTGTPYLSIVNAAVQFRHIIQYLLELDPALVIDEGSFDQAEQDLSDLLIYANWAIYEATDSAVLFSRLAAGVAARIWLNQEGKFKLHVLPPPGSVVLWLTEPQDVLGPESGGGSIRAGRTPPSALYNHIRMQSRRDPVTGEYERAVEVEDAASQAAYRTKNTLEIRNDFIWQEESASAVVAKYLAWHKDPKWRVSLRVFGLPSLHLELLDKIAITSGRMPGGWTAKPFYVEQIRRTCSDGTNIDVADLVVREV